jgi:hypothetical protein
VAVAASLTPRRLNQAEKRQEQDKVDHMNDQLSGLMSALASYPTESTLSTAKEKLTSAETLLREVAGRVKHHTGAVTTADLQETISKAKQVIQKAESNLSKKSVSPERAAAAAVDAVVRAPELVSPAKQAGNVGTVKDTVEAEKQEKQEERNKHQTEEETRIAAENHAKEETRRKEDVAHIEAERQRQKAAAQSTVTFHKAIVPSTATVVEAPVSTVAAAGKTEVKAEAVVKSAVLLAVATTEPTHSLGSVDLDAGGVGNGLTPPISPRSEAAAHGATEVVSGKSPLKKSSAGRATSTPPPIPERPKNESKQKDKGKSEAKQKKEVDGKDNAAAKSEDKKDNAAAKSEAKQDKGKGAAKPEVVVAPIIDSDMRAEADAVGPTEPTEPTDSATLVVLRAAELASMSDNKTTLPLGVSKEETERARQSKLEKAKMALVKGILSADANITAGDAKHSAIMAVAGAVSAAITYIEGARAADSRGINKKYHREILKEIAEIQLAANDMAAGKSEGLEELTRLMGMTSKEMERDRPPITPHAFGFSEIIQSLLVSSSKTLGSKNKVKAGASTATDEIDSGVGVGDLLTAGPATSASTITGPASHGSVNPGSASAASAPERDTPADKIVSTTIRLISAGLDLAERRALVTTLLGAKRALLAEMTTAVEAKARAKADRKGVAKEGVSVEQAAKETEQKAKQAIVAANQAVEAAAYRLYREIESTTPLTEQDKVVLSIAALIIRPRNKDSEYSRFAIRYAFAFDSIKDAEEEEKLLALTFPRFDMVAEPTLSSTDEENQKAARARRMALATELLTWKTGLDRAAQSSARQSNAGSAQLAVTQLPLNAATLDGFEFDSIRGDATGRAAIYIGAMGRLMQAEAGLTQLLADQKRLDDIAATWTKKAAPLRELRNSYSSSGRVLTTKQQEIVTTTEGHEQAASNNKQAIAMAVESLNAVLNDNTAVSSVVTAIAQVLADAALVVRDDLPRARYRLNRLEMQVALGDIDREGDGEACKSAVDLALRDVNDLESLLEIYQTLCNRIDDMASWIPAGSGSVDLTPLQNVVGGTDAAAYMNEAQEAVWQAHDAAYNLLVAQTSAAVDLAIAGVTLAPSEAEFTRANDVVDDLLRKSSVGLNDEFASEAEKYVSLDQEDEALRLLVQVERARSRVVSAQSTDITAADKAARNVVDANLRKYATAYAHGSTSIKQTKAEMDDALSRKATYEEALSVLNNDAIVRGSIKSAEAELARAQENLKQLVKTAALAKAQAKKAPLLASDQVVAPTEVEMTSAKDRVKEAENILQTRRNEKKEAIKNLRSVTKQIGELREVAEKSDEEDAISELMRKASNDAVGFIEAEFTSLYTQVEALTDVIDRIKTIPGVSDDTLSGLTAYTKEVKSNAEAFKEQFNVFYDVLASRSELPSVRRKAFADLQELKAVEKRWIGTATKNIQSLQVVCELDERMMNESNAMKQTNAILEALKSGNFADLEKAVPEFGEVPVLGTSGTPEGTAFAAGTTLQGLMTTEVELLYTQRGMTDTTVRNSELAACRARLAIVEGELNEFLTTAHGNAANAALIKSFTLAVTEQKRLHDPSSGLLSSSLENRSPAARTIRDHADTNMQGVFTSTIEKLALEEKIKALTSFNLVTAGSADTKTQISGIVDQLAAYAIALEKQLAVDKKARDDLRPAFKETCYEHVDSHNQFASFAKNTKGCASYKKKLAFGTVTAVCVGAVALTFLAVFWPVGMAVVAAAGVAAGTAQVMAFSSLLFFIPSTFISSAGALVSGNREENSPSKKVMKAVDNSREALQNAKKAERVIGKHTNTLFKAAQKQAKANVVSRMAEDIKAEANRPAAASPAA